MGIGFLSMLSGIMNIDQELYEAAYVDGIKKQSPGNYLYYSSFNEATDVVRCGYVYCKRI